MTRAFRIHAFGGPEVLLIDEVDVGQPGPGMVRIRIHAIGLNRTEITLRSGRLPVKPALPANIGFEAAGVIEAVGPDSGDFKIGDRIALVPTYQATDYTLYGEESLAPVRSLVRIPDNISFVDAAATWVAFGTAWSGLVALGGLQAGQTVLIPAASSSVGLAAIQIANRIGARPIALTRTSAKAAALRGNGAADVIATAEQDVVTEVRRLTDGKGADLVFDPVAGPAFERLVDATADDGLLVLYGALDGKNPTTIPPFGILARGITIRGLGLPRITLHDRELAALKAFVGDGLADGTLRPVIERIVAFDEIADAHRFMEAGEQVGKIVVAL